jgi:hypothetical protein
VDNFVDKQSKGVASPYKSRVSLDCQKIKQFINTIINQQVKITICWVTCFSDGVGVDMNSP